jgi:hypothetical protein
MLKITKMWKRTDSWIAQTFLCGSVPGGIINQCCPGSRPSPRNRYMLRLTILTLSLAYIEDGVCRLISRKHNQYKSFRPLTAALAKLPIQNAIIDGEVVCLDANGKSVFLDLMRSRKANALLYCFDLLWLNNEDLRNFPLVERKLRLWQLVRASRNTSLLYASHIERQGVRLFQAICQQDCEGIVGKYKRGTYAAWPASWVKILNPGYSQKRGRKEMFDKLRERIPLHQ